MNSIGPKLYVGTTVEGGSDAAFGVNHGTGHIKAYPAGVSGPMGNYVRAVRGGTSYGINDFVDNGDGTVTDHATGLMWQQADSGSGMDWEDALAYAEDSTMADYDDWRLPNIKELQSIVDYSRSPSAGDADNQGPAIDTDFFRDHANFHPGQRTTILITDTSGRAPAPTSAGIVPNTTMPGMWPLERQLASDGADFHGAGARTIRHESTKAAHWVKAASVTIIMSVWCATLTNSVCLIQTPLLAAGSSPVFMAKVK